MTILETKTRLTSWLVLVSLLLTGCGFHLRGDYGLSERLNPMVIVGVDAFSPFYRELKNLFELSGVVLTEDPESARTLLRIEDESTDRLVTAVDDRGKASEYEMIRGVTFSLRDAASGEKLVSSHTVKAGRVFSDPAGVGFGKQATVSEIRRQLDEEIANSMARIIAMALR